MATAAFFTVLLVGVPESCAGVSLTFATLKLNAGVYISGAPTDRRVRNALTAYTAWRLHPDTRTIWYMSGIFSLIVSDTTLAPLHPSQPIRIFR